jgi:hypothetical protein
MRHSTEQTRAISVPLRIVAQQEAQIRKRCMWLATAVVLSALSLKCLPVAAQSGEGLKSLPNVYADVKLGTQGLGFDLAYQFAPGLYARGNLNGYSTSRDITESSVDYRANVRLQTTGLLIDWHPFDSGFRLSGGLYYNGNKFDLTGKPALGTFNLNGVTYSSADIGSLEGSLKFRSTAPYLGLGYFKSFSGFSLTGDAGVMFSGTPKVRLDVTCGALLAGSIPAICAQAQQDAAREAERARDSASSLRYYPVLSIGVGYAF